MSCRARRCGPGSGPHRRLRGTSSRTGARPSRACALERRRGQVVEVGDRVGLRPQADLPSVAERTIGRLDDPFAVEMNLELVVTRFCGQVVPGVLGDLAVPAGELDAAAVLDVVDAHVVL